MAFCCINPLSPGKNKIKRQGIEGDYRECILDQKEAAETVASVETPVFNVGIIFTGRCDGVGQHVFA
jgi:hypothetical protein